VQSMRIEGSHRETPFFRGGKAMAHPIEIAP